MQEKLTTCVVCGQDFAKYTCKLCGADVCDADYDKKKGICMPCLQGDS